MLARATALIRADANLAQPYFSDAARSAVAGTTNYEVRRSRELGLTPSLPHIRYNLTLEPAALAALVQQMIATNDPDIVTRVRKFLENNREIQSVKSTIEVDTSWMTPAMRQDMNVPLGVDFRAVKQHCTTVYIIIPPKELLTKAAYFRLLTSTCLRHCYRYDGVPVTLLVEEAFVLGHLDELENASSILRGFNGRLLIVYQTLGQAKKHFPNTWGLFGGGSTLAFRPAEPETAAYLVERAGQHSGADAVAHQPLAHGRRRAEHQHELPYSGSHPAAQDVRHAARHRPCVAAGRRSAAGIAGEGLFRAAAPASG